MNFIRRNIKIFIVLLLIIILSLVIGIKYYLNTNKNNNIESKEKEIKISTKEEKKEEDKKDKIYVDIKGAIKKPGVYEMDKDKKVIDVVYQAGGLSDEADTTYVNLAKKISDEMVIIIYTKDQIKNTKQTELLSTESSGSCVCPKISNDACISNNKKSTTTNNKSTSSKSSTSDKTTTTKSDEPVNINTATKEELQSISGIGEGKAQAIIDYREENGNFNSIEDILNVSGIGESIYEKIKDHITV